jgi:hypothetical protein
VVKCFCVLHKLKCFCVGFKCVTEHVWVNGYPGKFSPGRIPRVSLAYEKGVSLLTYLTHNGYINHCYYPSLKGIVGAVQ